MCDSYLYSSNQVRVGVQGYGELHATNTVITTGGDQYIGHKVDQGRGYLHLVNSSNSIGGEFIVAYQEDTYGDVLVEGNSALVVTNEDATDVIIGYGGTGLMHINDSRMAVNSNLYVGISSNSYGVYQSDNASITIGNNVNIGVETNATGLVVLADSSH